MGKPVREGTHRHGALKETWKTQGEDGEQREQAPTSPRERHAHVGLGAGNMWARARA